MKTVFFMENLLSLVLRKNYYLDESKFNFILPIEKSIFIKTKFEIILFFVINI